MHTRSGRFGRTKRDLAGTGHPAAMYRTAAHHSDVTLSASRDLLVGIAPLVIGVLIVGALIVAVGYGVRLRRRGDLRPSQAPPSRGHRPGDHRRDAPVATDRPGTGRRPRPHDLTGANTPVDPGPADGGRGGSGGNGGNGVNTGNGRSGKGGPGTFR